MAKDLPYYKFYVSEWMLGEISIESYELQGFFINVLNFYWGVECDTTLIKLKKKFRHDHELIEQLIEIGVIKVANEVVYINFLDNQFEERLIQSKKNSIAGKKSAEVRLKKKLENVKIENKKSTNVGTNVGTGVGQSVATKVQHKSNKLELEIELEKEKKDKVKEKVLTQSYKADKVTGEDSFSKTLTEEERFNQLFSDI